MIKVLFAGGELRQRRRETIMNPPEGISYVSSVDLAEMRPDYLVSKTPVKNRSWRDIMRKLAYALNIPNIRYVSSKYTRKVDLIHTPGQMLLNKKNYVIEIENVGALGFYNIKTIYKRMGIIKKFLKSRYCRHFICLSEASKASVKNTFKDDDIEKKITVVYPYVAINEYKNRRANDGKIVILISNTKFYMKGTREVLKTFEILNNKYKNLELQVVSNTPKEFVDKYSSFKNIKFFQAKFSKEELYRDFYSQCDIFVQPSYQDSLGLSYLEVAASGKPIITTDIFALPEVVAHEHNGFLIKAPLYMHNLDFTLKKEYFPMPVEDTENDFYKKIDGQKVVDELYRYLSILIEDKKLREEMGENSLKLIKMRFSDEGRKNKLKEIYENAIN